MRVPTTIVSDQRDPKTGGLSLLVMEAESATTQNLPPSGVLMIGRGDVADVRLSDPQVSRQHARLHIHEGGAMEVEDLGSANGTSVRDEAVPGNQRVSVRPGEPIVVGGATLVVRHLAGQGRLRRAWPHAYFGARLDEECARSKETREPLAVVRVHVEGSIGPAAVADILAPALRHADLLGLFAPAEYELLLPNTPPDLAAAIAQDLTERLRAGGATARTAMACYPRDGRTHEALLALASERLRPVSALAPGEAAAVIIEDDAMRKLHLVAGRIAAGMINVLIVGETGVGKEVMAETIHRLSPRAGARFLCLNCATLSDTLLESELFGHERGAFTGATETKAGLLESAPGGTVFLDEIGEIPIGLQARLLRVLETREVTRLGALKARPIDVRFISATNRDLEKECSAGRFRRDLYYRLKGTSLEMPALRARPSEILPLARTFIAQFTKDLARPMPLPLSREAEGLLLQYAWPGNIRELRNVMERAVLLCVGTEIEAEHLPPEIVDLVAESGGGVPVVDSGASAPASPPALDTTQPHRLDGNPPAVGSERDRIVRVLSELAGNQSRAAKQLGISRSTLVAKLEMYQIPRPRPRTPG